MLHRLFCYENRLIRLFKTLLSHMAKIPLNKSGMIKGITHMAILSESGMPELKEKYPVPST